jgi:hypothetical protein
MRGYLQLRPGASSGTEAINQKFRNDEERAVADKVPATEARSNKSAQAL